MSCTTLIKEAIIIHLQCGNYGIGGHYWTHPDYYSRDRIGEAGARGNRVATILTVLEAPKAGTNSGDRLL